MTIRRALVSVYDKTGLDELARGPARRPASRSSPPAAPRPRSPRPGCRSPGSRTLTGFPECLDGRVKTLHPAVHAGLLADLRLPGTPTQLDELGIAPFELLVSNLYPFEATVATGAQPGECVEQIDIGGPAMVRAAAKNHATSRSSPTRRSTGQVLEAVADRRLHPGAAPPPRGRGLRAHRHATTPRSRPGSPRPTRRTRPRRETGWPDVTGALWTAPRRAALRREPAPAGGPVPARRAAGPAVTASRPPSSCTARRCRTTTTSTPMPRWRAAFDFAAAVRGDHQALQPVRDRDRRRPGRGAPQGARLRPGVRVRRRDRGERRGHRRRWPAQIAEIFTEVVVAPGFEPAALEMLTGQEEPAAAALPRPPAGPGRAAAEWRQVGRRHARCSRPDRIDAPGDDPANWQLMAGAAGAADVLADLGFAWRACRAVKSNAILLAAGGARSGSAWARSTGSTRPGSRSPGPGTGPGRGRGQRRVLPVR